MEKYLNKLEQNEELVETIKFLIKDNAFDPEFLTTTVLEYIDNNEPKREPKEEDE